MDRISHKHNRRAKNTEDGPLQSPVEVKKNPGKHLAHAVPLSAVVKPGLHVHCPLALQIPLRQLQLDGGLPTVAVKHLPEPEIPSSQDPHPAGHCWQDGPKKPRAQDSHAVPVNPGAHEQVPDAEHTPEPAHGGEHAADSIPRREREPALEVGSWAMSGIESQRMTRLFEPAITEAQTLDEMAMEPADKGWEALVGGVEGRRAKAACPAYSG